MPMDINKTNPLLTFAMEAFGGVHIDYNNFINITWKTVGVM